eukprot:m.918307 g.918307  ORF g.918307 m.918307 type:complete len:303 (+) comp23743_c1_seq13:161-1069(+)
MFQSDRSNMWSHHHKHASPSFPPTWVVLTLLSALDTSAQSTWSPEPKVIDEVPEAQYEVSQPDESSESRKIVSVAIFGTIGILLVIAVVTGRRYCNATRLDNSPRINSSVESFSPADSHIHAGIGADILDNNERGLITPKRNAILDFSLVSSTSPQSECVTINGDQTLNDTATLGTRGRGSFSTCKTSNAAQLLGSEFSEEARVLTFDDSCCDENTEIAGDRSLFVPFDTNSSEVRLTIPFPRYGSYTQSATDNTHEIRHIFACVVYGRIVHLFIGVDSRACLGWATILYTDNKIRHRNARR